MGILLYTFTIYALLVTSPYFSGIVPSNPQPGHGDHALVHLYAKDATNQEFYLEFDDSLINYSGGLMEGVVINNIDDYLRQNYNKKIDLSTVVNATTTSHITDTSENEREVQPEGPYEGQFNVWHLSFIFKYIKFLPVDPVPPVTPAGPTDREYTEFRIDLPVVDV